MLTGTKKDLQQSPIRIGIIGTGFGQAVHIPSFKADPRCSVMAICNARESEGRHIANTHNIQKYFSDWKRLLQDKDIDAVSIAVPPYLQEKIAVEALTLGKPVFCEKPLATSIASAQAIADIATKANLANLIDFEFPEICQWIKAKNYIETSRLGNIYYVCINWHVETYANRNKLSSWKSDPDQGGGILNQFVSHCFYNIEWLLGPIKSLSAIGGKSSQDLRNGDTFSIIQLILESGSNISLNICSSASFNNCHRLEFYGDQGVMILQNLTEDYIRGFELFFGDCDGKNLCSVECGEDLSHNADGRIQVVSRLVKRFLDAILTGSAQRPNLVDGLRVQQLIEAAKESMKNRRWVECS